MSPRYSKPRGAGLWSAASALAAAPAARVGLITGFYVPQGSPPAAETDGPVGAALLAKGSAEIGIPCRLATDEPCRSACAAALAGAGIAGVPVDATRCRRHDRATWRRAGITHAISIERCGRSADGAPRNMRGLDISSYTAPLDELFTAGPWETIAVGDGGNEIGMGSLPRELIAQHVDHGETIACVTPARHLIVAGVSNWGAYASSRRARRVASGLARSGCSPVSTRSSTRRCSKRRSTTGRRSTASRACAAMTVDNLDMAVHHSKLREIRALVEAEHGL